MFIRSAFWIGRAKPEEECKLKDIIRRALLARAMKCGFQGRRTLEFCGRGMLRIIRPPFFVR